VVVFGVPVATVVVSETVRSRGSRIVVWADFDAPVAGSYLRCEVVRSNPS
jgi:hypothetical protein